MVLQRCNGNTYGPPPPPQSIVSDKPSKDSSNRTEREIKEIYIASESKRESKRQHQNKNKNRNHKCSELVIH